MITKDVKAMLTYSFSYADEIGWKKNGTYPQDAKLTLRNQLKEDLLVFLAYIYDDDSSSLNEQIVFINDCIQRPINAHDFMLLAQENYSNDSILSTAPLSLQYFVKDDLSPYSRRVGYGVSLAKYLINTFNDVGCYFIAYSGTSEYEQKHLEKYVKMMLDYIDSYGLLKNNPQDVRPVVAPNQETSGYTSRTRTTSGSSAAGFGSASSFGMGLSGGSSNSTASILGDIVLTALLGRSYRRSGLRRSLHRSLREIEEPSTYTQSHAELDVARMMAQYNMQHQDDGTVFDRNLMNEVPQTPMIDAEEEKNEERKISLKKEDDIPLTGIKIEAPGDSNETLEELMDTLDSLVGLKSVKESLNNLINIVKVRKMREEMGLKAPEMSLHLVFSGNPGTGKTTVARLLARIYHKLGVVSKGQLVEVDRAGLVEGYVGQTALKTSKVCDEAMGGVLFIDEAYTLTNSEGQDFGQEAVDTLLKRMEDNRADLIVIVAGYTDLMREFVESNPGLKSRFNKFIEFPDYTGSELFEIYELMCCSQDYQMDEGAKAYVIEHLNEMAESEDDNFANAREVRNYFERCVERQATRIVGSAMLDESALTTLVVEDVTE